MFAVIGGLGEEKKGPAYRKIDNLTIDLGILKGGKKIDQGTDAAQGVPKKKLYQRFGDTSQEGGGRADIRSLGGRWCRLLSKTSQKEK